MEHLQNKHVHIEHLPIEPLPIEHFLIEGPHIEEHQIAVLPFEESPPFDIPIENVVKKIIKKEGHKTQRKSRKDKCVGQIKKGTGYF